MRKLLRGHGIVGSFDVAAVDKGREATGEPSDPGIRSSEQGDGAVRGPLT